MSTYRYATVFVSEHINPVEGFSADTIYSSRYAVCPLGLRYSMPSGAQIYFVHKGHRCFDFFPMIAYHGSGAL